MQLQLMWTHFAWLTGWLSPPQSADERDISATVQAALEAAVQRHTFPKANVDVYCLILESGGADAAVAITAASLAIADAGIEMYDLVSACSVVRAVW